MRCGARALPTLPELCTTARSLPHRSSAGGEKSGSAMSSARLCGARAFGGPARAADVSPGVAVGAAVVELLRRRHRRAAEQAPFSAAIAAAVMLPSRSTRAPRESGAGSAVRIFSPVPRFLDFFSNLTNQLFLNSRGKQKSGSTPFTMHKTRQKRRRDCVKKSVTHKIMSEKVAQFVSRKGAS